MPISQPKIKIITQNFQDIILGVYQVYEVTLNLTQPHLPSFVMTYHDLATQLNQTFKSQPNPDGSPQNCSTLIN